VKPTQLSLARFPGTPTLHPTGDVAVVALRRIDLDVDDYSSQLWLVSTDGGEPRQLTYGWRDASPVYSPDGAWLAFVRAERDMSGKVGKAQLWVMPTAGGEPRRLTDHPIGVDAPVWSPDSARLAFLAREPEPGRYGTIDGVGPEKEPPRRITKLSYRVDGLGFLGGRPRQIWIVGIDDSEPERITMGDIDHEDVDWSPVGDLLTFVAAGHDERFDDLRYDAWVCRPDGTGRRALTSGGLSVETTRFNPDGSAVMFAGCRIDQGASSGVARNRSLWTVPTDGSGAAVRLTDEEIYNLGAPLGVCEDGVLFANESRGAIELLLVPYTGGAPSVLMSGERQIQGADAVSTPSGPLVVASVADATTWGEVVLREWDGAERMLTDFNAGYAADATIFGMDEITASAPDGYPVHGWLVRPSGDGPHPLLLMIHGGPFAQYGWALFDEAQVYAGAGYAVLMANPRGSSGYGQAHGRAVIGNVGEVSTGDLMAILDAALKSSDLDASNVGVLGGSHGGFMTTWLAAHEGHRFRAACSERAVNAIDSFTGSSDIGWFFADDLYGRDIVGQRKQSPLTYANDIRIPMLIVHSEQDWRCPIEQAQRLYVTLRRNGTPTEMLLFPGEGHELTRSGLPSHRVARFEAIVDWFDRYMR
jgi:dipeptidyl aminopeptidase/acylaminoacyl peptidase